MGKISKGFSLTIAILGVLSLIWGICISVISWVLSSKAPTSITHNDGSYRTDSYSIQAYWWGGFGFIIPGILGIVAGCTRNVVAMVFFLIFDILCLLASLGMSIMVAMLIAIWDTVNEKLGTTCFTSHDFYESECICDDGAGGTWKLVGVTCKDLTSIQGMLSALVALGALAALMSSFASYVSCCSLCNQEQDFHRGVIVRQPGYVAPPTMVVAHTSNVQQAAPQQYPPKQYQPQQDPSTHQVPPPYEVLLQQYPVSHDKAKLVTNEVV